jgi:dipeptidyl aminopeptidase/acylaminoacyl peptidase
VAPFWVGVGLQFSVSAGIALWLVGMYFYLYWRYGEHVFRIFVEKPLFIIPRGQPVPEGEEVSFPTTDGLTLRGVYFKSPRQRRGVILFGLEFGSNRWSAWAYVQHLVEAGFDVLAFEPRNQGDSDRMPGYEPMQWLTHYEVNDARAALAWLKGRPDADPRGVGFFGISKGGNAGLYLACHDRSILCCVTDGSFGTYTTLVPYMRHWFRIYNTNVRMHGVLPSWYYGLVGMKVLREIEKRLGCHFPHLEKSMARLCPRPWLLIHGEADTYIKPEFAQALRERARACSELWLVPGAKHNQALHLEGPAYRERVLRFFERHLADPAVPSPAGQGSGSG